MRAAMRGDVADDIARDMTEPPSIRPETAADRRAVRTVIEAAFEDGAEADLVDALCADGDLAFSLVAENGGEIVGHVALSRMQARPAPSVSAPSPCGRTGGRRGPARRSCAKA